MSIYDGIGPIDLSLINTYELASRPSKVTAVSKRFTFQQPSRVIN